MVFCKISHDGKAHLGVCGRENVTLRFPQKYDDKKTGGLGWGGNMRFRTGLNLIDLTAEVSNRLHEVKFPFMIMHDPGDGEAKRQSSDG